MKYEYKILKSGPLNYVSEDKIEELLNNLGKEEWELVSLTSENANKYDDSTHIKQLVTETCSVFILKRELK